jgi:enolase
MKKAHKNVTIHWLSGKDPNKKGFSKRAVKLRELKGSETDKCQIDAAKECFSADKKEFDGVSFKVLKSNMLLKMALLAVSKNPVKCREDLLKLVDKDWHEFTDLEKTTEDHDWTIDELFTSKDQDILVGFMNELYEINPEDAAEVINLAIPVSTDQ